MEHVSKTAPYPPPIEKPGEPPGPTRCLYNGTDRSRTDDLLRVKNQTSLSREDLRRPAATRKATLSLGFSLEWDTPGVIGSGGEAQG